jgi:hypothetical protein
MPVEHGVIKQIAYVVDDLVARLGAPLACALTPPGICRVHYHDTVRRLGHFLELWESTEAMRGLEMVESAAREWGGREPVRRIGV